MQRRFWITTVGCPKNDVDSQKLAGRLTVGGYLLADSPGQADLVVVNTCAFIEAAREESVETILELDAARRDGSRLVVTGCLAERFGDELAKALPEVGLVAGFGVPVELTTSRRVVKAERAGAGATAGGSSFDLLELARPPARAPWAYLKVAEGCDRRCGFCAIPSFRGRQRSRSLGSILGEIDSLQVREIVLVAQDLASFGRDRDVPRAAHTGEPGIVELVREASKRVDRVRLLYLYPSSLTDGLIDAVLGTNLPYFDLSLQHASGRLLRQMRRFGNRERFMERIERIRSLEPASVLRSSFILGYPGETEEDHDELLRFLSEAQLDWAGFFTFSPEAGTHAEGIDEQVAPGLAIERLRECSELQEEITSRRRSDLVGSTCEVLVDTPGTARSFREAPEIDGIIRVPPALAPGWVGDVLITGAVGPDLDAEPPAVPVAELAP